MTPAHGPSRSIGANCSATVRPTAATLEVSSKTSQSMAMRAIQPPMLLKSEPTNDSRKLNTRKEENTSRQAVRSLSVVRGAVAGEASAPDSVTSVHHPKLPLKPTEQRAIDS